MQNSADIEEGRRRYSAIVPGNRLTTKRSNFFLSKVHSNFLFFIVCFIISKSSSVHTSAFEAGWFTNSISQRFPITGANNSLDIVLSAGVLLNIGDKIQISGLTGIYLQPAIPLLLMGNSSDLFLANFSNFTLILTVQSETQAGTVLQIAFDFLNPSLPQNGPDIFISVFNSSGEVKIAGESMTSSNVSVLGVLDGGQALHIVSPRFEIKLVGQTNPLAQAENEIGLTLAANIDLIPNNVICAAGFIGLDLNGTVVVDGNGTLILSGMLESSISEICLTVVSTIKVGSLSIIRFRFRNPHKPQQHSNITIFGRGSANYFQVAEMDMNENAAYGIEHGCLPMYIVVPRFNFQAIGQSDPLAAAFNTLSLTLEANCDLDSGTNITIIGLSGSAQTDEHLPVMSNATEYLSPLGSWNPVLGRLLLTVDTRWPGTVAVVLSFALKNGLVAQNSPAVSAVASLPSGAVIAAAAMTTAGQVLLGISNGSDPLRIAVPSFTVRAIGQSNPLAGASNVISLTLEADCELLPGTNITVVGLTGTDTPDGPIPVATNATSSVVGSGMWNRNAGQAVFFVSGPWLASTDAVMRIAVRNGAVPQDARSVRVFATLPSGAEISASVMSVPGAVLLGISNGSNPLKVVVPSFVFNAVGQADPLAFAKNMITATLQANCDIEPGSNLTLSGFLGSSTSDGSLPVVSNASVVLGTWIESIGSLTLAVVDAQALRASSSYVFSFVLQNGGTAQPAPPISVSVQMPSGAHIARTRVDSLAYDIFGVQNGSLPLEIFVPLLVRRVVMQSNPLASAFNIITIIIQSNCDLEAGTNITIFGLTGAQTPDGFVPVSSNASGIFEGSAVWKSRGILLLTTSELWEASSTFRVSFVLQNGPVAQNAPIVSVAASLPSGALITAAAMTTSGQNLLNISNGSNPLRIFVPSFTLREIGQSNPLVSSANSIDITLRADCDLWAGSNITVSGLTGAATEDGTIVVTVDSAEMLKSSWNRVEGSISIMIPDMFYGSASHIFSFNLQNGAAAQQAPPVSVAASMLYGARISAAGMLQPNIDLLGVANGSNPMLLLVPIFTSKAIGQDNPLAFAANTLFTTLQANCDLARGTNITLSGLIGASTIDSGVSVMVNSSVLASTASLWTHSSGVLVIEAPFTFFGTSIYIIRIEIRNGANAQESPIVLIAASLPSATQIRTSIMTVEDISLLGVENGSQPLKIFSPTFTIRKIGQNNPTALAMNNISVTLQADCDLAAGTNISISGLFGSDSADGLLFVQSNASNALPAVGSWNHEFGRFVFQLGGQIHYLEIFILTFQLRNGEIPQSTPPIYASASMPSGAVIPAIRMTVPDLEINGIVNGSNPMQIFVPSFVLDEIGQSNPVALMDNTIFVTLQADYFLDPSSTIVIFGLVGSITVDGEISLISNATGVFSSSGWWNLTSSSLTLSTVNTLEAFTTYVFSFNLTNGGIAQDPPSVSVKGIISSGARIRATQMTGSAASLFGIPQGSSPLKIFVPSFTFLAIGQSNPMALATNVIYITLQPNYRLEAGLTVTIFGLTGAITPDCSIPLNSNATDVLPESGNWSMMNGSLVFTVLHPLQISVSYVISFTLQNGGVPQQAPNVYLTGKISSGARISTAEMLEPNKDLLGVQNGANALEIFVPSFILRDIGQTNPLATELNTLTVTLQLDYTLQPPFNIEIYGLTGTNTQDNNIQLSSNASALFPTIGFWNQSTGRLIFAIDGPIQGMTSYVFSFNLRNGNIAQKSPPVFITASFSSGVSIAAELMTVPNFELLGVTNGANPLEIAVPFFTTRAIGQSNPLAAAYNTIKFTLQADCNLAAGSNITLFGLTGAMTPNAVIMIMSNATSLPLIGYWIDYCGNLSFSTPNVLLGSTTYTFSFELQNGVHAQHAPSVSVEASLASGLRIAAISMQRSYQVLLGVENGSMPLEIYVPTISLRNIGQSNPLALAWNIITITLRFDFDLAPGTNVSIFGLTGASTPDGRRQVVSNSSGLLPAFGLWVRGEGSLTLYVTSLLPGLVDYVLSFQLQNGASAQGAPTVSLTAALPSGGLLPPIAMVPDYQDLLGVKNGSRAMYIVVPYFSVRGIGQNNPLAWGINLITVTLQADCDLVKGTNVTISGLTGTATADGVLYVHLNLSAAPVLAGIWRRSSGSLLLPIVAALPGSASYVLSFTVRNGLVNQDSPSISIGATMPSGAQIAVTVMSVPNTDLLDVANGTDPLRVFAPSFTICSIGQSNPLASASNTLTVTIQTDHGLVQGSNITIFGLFGTSTASGTIAVKSNVSYAVSANGIWNQSVGMLVIAVLQDLRSNLSYTLTFSLRNGVNAQGSPPVSVMASLPSGAEIPPTFMNVTVSTLLGVSGGSLPLLIFVPSFSTFEIGQSNPFASASNTITATLEADCDIATDSNISISGLSGSLSDALVNLTALVNGSVFDFNLKLWNRTSGTFVVSPGSLLKCQSMISISFGLRNGLVAQASPSIRVYASLKAGPFNGFISPVVMSMQNGNIFGVRNGTNALTIVLPKFDLALIVQSIPFASALNSITVTLRSLYTISQYSTLTISGLSGSQTNDSFIDVDSTNFSFFSLAQWSRVGGNITFTANTTIDFMVPYVLTFYLQNGALAQQGPSITISGIIQAGLYNSFIGPVAMTTLNSDLMGVVNGSNPLNVIIPAFSVRSIIQNNPFPSAMNKLVVTLQANCDPGPNSTVYISGLLGSQTATGVIPLNLTTASKAIFSASAMWIQSAGALTVSISQTLLQGVNYSFAFVLQNNAIAQASLPVSISARFVSGAFQTMFPTNAMTVSNVSLLGISNALNPFLIFVPAFSVRTISQSSPLAYASNNISVMLRTNCNMQQGTLITISGLIGSQTIGGNISLLSSVGFATKALWNQSNGNLILTSTTDILYGVNYSVVFELQNSPGAQVSPPVYISAQLKFSSLGDTLYYTVPSSMMMMPDQSAMGVVNGSNPLLIIVPGFFVSTSAQSCPLISASNTIIISLQTNCDFAASSTISISGFVGSQTASGPIALAGNMSSYISSPAYWNQSNGTLALVLAQAIYSSSSYILSFNLRNGQMAQSAKLVRISGSVKAGKYTSPIAWIPLTSSETAAYGISNGSNPMFFVVPRFLQANVGQSNPLTSASNNITVTFQSNSDLSPDSIISFQGFTGSQTVNIHVVNISYSQALLAPSAILNQTGGSFNLTVIETMPASISYTFSFEIQNGPAPQLAQQIFISAVIQAGTFNSGISIVPMVASNQARLSIPNGSMPMFFYAPKFVIMSGSQSNPLALASNNITILLQSNCDISIGSTIILGNMSGTMMTNSSLLIITSNPVGGLASSAYWNWSSATLMVKVSGTLFKNTSYQMTFSVQNGRASQPSPTVLISATINCGKYNSQIAPSDIIMPNTIILGVSNGSNVLLIFIPSFLFTAVAQTNPLAAASNNITATFQANCDIVKSSSITLLNLVGSQTNSTSSLSVWSNPPGIFGSSAVWSEAIGMVIVKVSAAVIPRNTSFAFTIQIQNIAAPQSSPNIRASATLKSSGSYDSSISFQNCTLSLGSAFGVPFGASPLFILAPTFTTKEIGQSIPLTNLVNTISVTLNLNCNLPSASVITISNILGSQTEDNLTFPVYSGSGLQVGGFGAWTRSTGTLLLTTATDFFISPSSATPVGSSTSTSISPSNTSPIQTTGISIFQIQSSSMMTISKAATNIQTTIATFLGNNTFNYNNRSTSAALSTNTPTIGAKSILIWFQLQNSATPQNSPAVSISAVVKSGLHDAPIAQTVMNVLNQSALGVGFGSNPMYVIAPQFTTKVIGQSNPLANASTVITSTLQANCNIAPGSTITLINLVGSQTASTSALPIYSMPSGVFGSIGGWTSSIGALVLVVVNQGLFQNSSYVVWFELQNSEMAQQSPVINVSALIKVSSQVAEIDSTAFSTSKIAALGVENGASPLYVVVPNFTQKLVLQSNPLASASNRVLVTLQTNFEFTASSLITISHLIGAQTPDNSSLPIYSSPAGYFGSSAYWSRSEGILILTVLPAQGISATGTHVITTQTAAMQSSNQRTQSPILQSTLLQFSSSVGQTFESTSGALQTTSTSAIVNNNRSASYTTLKSTSTAIVLTSDVSFSKPMNNTVIVWFSLQNSATPQNSPAVSISAVVKSGLHDAPIAQTVMNVLNQSALGVGFGSNPMYVIAPQFTTKVIGQSNPLANASTVITSTLQANCNIAPGSTITLINLVGSQTASTSALPIYSMPSGVFGSIGGWTSSIGALVLVVVNQGLFQNLSYVVWFELQNSAMSQSSPIISINALISAGVYDSPVYITAMVSSDNELFGISGGEAPLFASAPTFLNFEINQTTPFPDLKNIWTVSFRLSVDLLGQDGSALIINGLIPSISYVYPFITPISPSSSVADYPLSVPVFNSNKIVFSVLSNATIFSETNYIFSFYVNNPSIQNSFSDLRVSTVGSVTIQPTLISVPKGRQLLGINYFFCPPLIWLPSFAVKNVLQSQPICGEINELTVTLQPNLDLQAFSNITMAGLMPSSTGVQLFFQSTDAFLALTTSQVLHDEVLLTVPVGKTLSANSIYSFNLQLSNQIFEQAVPSAIVISATASYSARINPAPMTSDPARMLFGIEEGNVPVQCTVPSFARREVSQSNPLANQINIIKISLQINVDLSWDLGSQIVISGFQNTFIRANVVDLLNASIFCSSATSNMNEGSAQYLNGKLTMFVCSEATMLANTLHVISFKLQNPAASGSAQTLQVQASQRNGIISIGPVPLQSPDEEIFGVINGSNPGIVCAAEFVAAQITQSSPIVGWNNTFVVLLETNVMLQPGSNITISGLRGTPNTGRNVVHLSRPSLNDNSEDGAALFCSSLGCPYSDGSLFLTLRQTTPQSVGAVFLPYTLYALQFTLVNPTTIQPSPANILVQASGFINVPSTPMSQPQEIIIIRPDIGSISAAQSNPLCGAHNTITFSCTLTGSMSNVRFTISGLLGKILDSSNDPLTSNEYGSILFTSASNSLLLAGTFSKQMLVIEAQKCSVMYGDVSYMFTINLINLDQEMAGSTVLVSGSGHPILSSADEDCNNSASESVISFTSTPVQPSNQDAMGVAGGSMPFFLIKLKFLVATISQTVPLVGATNSISISLMINYDPVYFESSLLTLTGLGVLLHASNVTDYDVSVQCPYDAYDPCDPGSITGVATEGVFNFDVSGILPNVLREYEFELENPLLPSVPAPVTICASSIGATVMVSESRTIIGVVNGSMPSLLIQPEFLVYEIDQTSPICSALNKIEVNLELNFELSPGSSIYIQLFPNRYELPAKQLSWNGNSSSSATIAFNSPGLWTITVHKDPMQTKQHHLFSWTITNPPNPQNAPTVSLYAYDADLGVTTLKTIMISSGESAWGVESGATALFLVAPTFSLAAMGQTNPIAATPNTLCLTLQSTVDLPAGSNISLLSVKPSWLVGIPVLASSSSSYSVVQNGEYISAPIANALISKKGIVFPLLAGLAAGTICNLNLNFVNQKNSQSQLSNFQLGGILHDIINVEMVQSTVDISSGIVYGVTNGSYPFYVIVPMFLPLQMGANNYMNSASFTTIGVTLSPNCDIYSQSNITVTSLGTLYTRNGNGESRVSVVASSKLYQISVVLWDGVTLILTVTSGMLPANELNVFYIQTMGSMLWTKSVAFISASVPLKDVNDGSGVKIKEIFSPIPFTFSSTALSVQPTFSISTSTIFISRSLQNVEISNFAVNITSGYGGIVKNGTFTVTMTNSSPCKLNDFNISNTDIFVNSTGSLFLSSFLLTEISSNCSSSPLNFEVFVQVLSDGSDWSEPHYFSIIFVTELTSPLVKLSVVDQNTIEASWSVPFGEGDCAASTPAGYSIRLLQTSSLMSSMEVQHFIMENENNLCDVTIWCCQQSCSSWNALQRIIFAGLTAGSWMVEVIAYNQANMPGATGLSPVIRLLYPPSSPYHVIAVQISEQSLDISWNQPEDCGFGNSNPFDLSGFEVLVTLGEKMYHVTSWRWGTRASYTPSDSLSPTLEQGDSYQIQVRAYNAAGWSDYSSQIQVTIRGKPKKVAVTNILENGDGLMVFWSEPADVGVSLSDVHSVFNISYLVALSDCLEVGCRSSSVCPPPTYTCFGSTSILVRDSMLTSGRVIYIQVYVVCTVDNISFTSPPATVTYSYRSRPASLISSAPIQILQSAYPCADTYLGPNHDALFACVLPPDCPNCQPEPVLSVFLEYPTLSMQRLLKVVNLTMSLNGQNKMASATIQVVNSTLVKTVDNSSANFSSWYSRNIIKVQINKLPVFNQTGNAKVCWNLSGSCFVEFPMYYVQVDAPSVVNLAPPHAPHSATSSWHTMSMVYTLSSNSWARAAGLGWAFEPIQGSQLTLLKGHNISVGFGGILSSDVIVRVENSRDFRSRHLAVSARAPVLSGFASDVNQILITIHVNNSIPVTIVDGQPLTIWKDAYIDCLSTARVFLNISSIIRAHVILDAPTNYSEIEASIGGVIVQSIFYPVERSDSGLFEMIGDVQVPSSLDLPRIPCQNSDPALCFKSMLKIGLPGIFDVNETIWFYTPPPPFAGSIQIYTLNLVGNGAIRIANFEPDAGLQYLAFLNTSYNFSVTAAMDSNLCSPMSILVQIVYSDGSKSDYITDVSYSVDGLFIHVAFRAASRKAGLVDILLSLEANVSSETCFVGEGTLRTNSGVILFREEDEAYVIAVSPSSGPATASTPVLVNIAGMWGDTVNVGMICDDVIFELQNAPPRATIESFLNLGLSAFSGTGIFPKLSNFSADIISTYNTFAWTMRNNSSPSTNLLFLIKVEVPEQYVQKCGSSSFLTFDGEDFRNSNKIPFLFLSNPSPSSARVVSCFPSNVSIHGGTSVTITLSNFSVLFSANDAYILFGTRKAKIDQVLFSNMQGTRLITTVPASSQYGTIDLTVCSAGLNASLDSAVQYVTAWNPEVYLVSPKILYTAVREPVIMRGTGFPVESIETNEVFGRLISPSGSIFSTDFQMAMIADDAMLLTFESPNISETGWGVITLFVNGAEVSQSIRFINPTTEIPKLTFNDPCCSMILGIDGENMLAINGNLNGYRYGRSSLIAFLSSIDGNLQVPLGSLITVEKNGQLAQFDFLVSVPEDISILLLLKYGCNFTVQAAEGPENSKISSYLSFSPMQILAINSTSGYLNEVNYVQVLVQGLWFSAEQVNITANASASTVQTEILDVTRAGTILDIILSIASTDASDFMYGNGLIINLSDGILNLANFAFELKNQAEFLTEVQSFSGFMSINKRELSGTLLGGETLEIRVKSALITTCFNFSIYFDGVGAKITTILNNESQGVSSLSTCVLSVIIPSMNLPPRTVSPVLQMFNLEANLSLGIVYDFYIPLASSINDFSPTRITPASAAILSIRVNYLPIFDDDLYVVVKFRQVGTDAGNDVKSSISVLQNYFFEQSEVISATKDPACTTKLCPYTIDIITPVNLGEGIIALHDICFSV